MGYRQTNRQKKWFEVRTERGRDKIRWFCYLGEKRKGLSIQRVRFWYLFVNGVVNRVRERPARRYISSILERKQPKSILWLCLRGLGCCETKPNIRVSRRTGRINRRESARNKQIGGKDERRSDGAVVYRGCLAFLRGVRFALNHVRQRRYIDRDEPGDAQYGRERGDGKV